MLLETLQRATAWFLSLEIIGLLVGLSERAGLPPTVAPIIVLLALFAFLYKVSTDRFILQRWRFKYNRWRRP